MRPEIKICGLKRREDVEYVNEAGADYAGFVFFKKSHRNVTYAQAEELLSHLDSNIKSVAVCVSPDMEALMEMKKLGFDRIQIHGDFPAQALDAGGIPLWQAVNLLQGDETKNLIRHSKIEGYVIDGAKYGGGKTFGWDKNDPSRIKLAKSLRDITDGRKLILAGGLTVENVTQGIELFQPDIVDVSSGVETDKIKDKEKINQFIREVKKI